MLSGGVKIQGWQVDAAGWWHSQLAGIAHGDWTPSRLFVDGARRPPSAVAEVGLLQHRQTGRAEP